MTRRKNGAKNQRVHAPRKPRSPKIPEGIKAELQIKAEQFVDEFLRPTFIEPPPDDHPWSHIVDIYTKWHRNYFYFCSKYRAPGLSPVSEFEARFARLEYVGSEKFSIAFMRQTGRWVETDAGLSIEEALERIKEDPFFQP